MARFELQAHAMVWPRNHSEQYRAWGMESDFCQILQEVWQERNLDRFAGLMEEAAAKDEVYLVNRLFRAVKGVAGEAFKRSMDAMVFPMGEISRLEIEIIIQGESLTRLFAGAKGLRVLIWKPSGAGEKIQCGIVSR